MTDAFVLREELVAEHERFDSFNQRQIVNVA